jgi:hypothetical protein
VAGPTRTPARRDGTTAEKRPLFQHPERVLIVGGVLFAVVVLIAIAIGSADTSPLRTEQPQPKEVQGFSPGEGAIVGPDTTISVDLADDLTGELTVCAPTPTDCTPIPLDQTRVVNSTGQISFQPTETTDITSFPTGPVTVRVDYHLQGSLTADVGSFAWSFTVKA